MEMTTDVRELFEIYQETRDPQAREQLIVAHLQLVRYVAGRMLPSLHSSVEMQDLVSYGTFGLIDAIERFDLSRGIKFSTFASYRIQGAINDEMRAQAWEPRSVRSLHRRIQTAVSDLEHELGRAPAEEEVATLVGIEVSELRRVDREMSSSRMLSLNVAVGDSSPGDERTLADLIVGDDDPHHGGVAAHIAEASVLLAEAMCRLPLHERVLLQLIYVEHMMLKDIARVLKVTDSWVSHLHTRSMVDLQRAMSAQY